MTDIAGGIPDFLQRKGETTLPTKPEKQPRQRRQPRAAAETAPEPAKKERKKPEPKERSAPETIKVTLKEYAETRVTAFQREFIKLYKILAPMPAKVRGQILAELQKVLG